MEDWQKRRILIWGKTRPEISKTYREIVCTGGVFEDTKKFVRLYPIPLRFLRDENTFKKYQWIEAKVTRNLRDFRPESYRIQSDTIKLQDVIKTKKNGNWDKRAHWILNYHNIFRSVEELKEKQKHDHTSLGLVKPAEIIDIKFEPTQQDERLRYWERFEEATNQLQLPFYTETEKQLKPLGPPDYRYKIVFRCDDLCCEKPHTFSVLDWELDALYFNQLGRGKPHDEAAGDVVKKLYEICSASKDTYFYLGNIKLHPHVFTIVGLWHPKKKDPLLDRQMRLFD